jgi:excisionase family DNA binding protein
MDRIPDPLERPTLTVDEAGRLLGLSRGSAYKAARSGELPTVAYGRRILVPTAKLRAILGL